MLVPNTLPGLVATAADAPTLLLPVLPHGHRHHKRHRTASSATCCTPCCRQYEHNARPPKKGCGWVAWRWCWLHRDRGGPQLRVLPLQHPPDCAPAAGLRPAAGPFHAVFINAAKPHMFADATRPAASSGGHSPAKGCDADDAARSWSQRPSQGSSRSPGGAPLWWLAASHQQHGVDAACKWD